jgi:N-acetylglucosamine-6-phosphate deacetylase
LATHLGNGCANVLPRHPNFIWEQLAADELYASFIVDGHHLPPATVKAMMRAKTPARSILVTDAVTAAGCPPGRYRIGDAEVELSPTGRVAAVGASNLAGSALALDRAVANTVKFTGLPLADVLPMASTIPAGCVGMQVAGQITADWDAEAGTLKIISVNS